MNLCQKKQSLVDIINLSVQNLYNREIDNYKDLLRITLYALGLKVHRRQICGFALYYRESSFLLKHEINQRSKYLLFVAGFPFLCLCVSEVSVLCVCSSGNAEDARSVGEAVSMGEAALVPFLFFLGETSCFRGERLGESSSAVLEPPEGRRSDSSECKCTLDILFGKEAFGSHFKVSDSAREGA